METTFYGMHTFYHEPETITNSTIMTQEDTGSLAYIVSLSIIGTILLTGVSYYVYRVKYPKKPTFEQI